MTFHSIEVVPLPPRGVPQWTGMFSAQGRNVREITTTSTLTPVRKILQYSLGYLDTLPFKVEKAMAPHCSTLAWKIPWTEEPGRLQSMGSQRVGHDWATSLHFTSMYSARTQHHTTFLLLLLLIITFSLFLFFLSELKLLTYLSSPVDYDPWCSMSYWSFNTVLNTLLALKQYFIN